MFSKWSSGVRTFFGKTISTGVFDFVSRLLGGVAQYTAPPICEALLVEMQATCNSGEMFLPTSHATASSSTSHSTALFITTHSSQQPGLSRAHFSSQPGPSHVHSLPLPGPSCAHSSTQAGPSQTRKRQSPDDRGPRGKRRREGTPSPSQYQSTIPRHLLRPRNAHPLHLIPSAGRLGYGAQLTDSLPFCNSCTCCS